MLDLRRLQILAALESEGTMTAAAARLHMSTSAISQQISLLEREVSLPLLERVGRRVRLNEAGKSLVAHYREIAAAGSTGGSPSFPSTVTAVTLDPRRESHHDH